MDKYQQHLDRELGQTEDVLSVEEEPPKSIIERVDENHYTVLDQCSKCYNYIYRGNMAGTMCKWCAEI